MFEVMRDGEQEDSTVNKGLFPCPPQSGDDSSEEEGEVDSEVELPRRQR